ncbi:MAG: hypothetical protein ACRDN0_12475, partial [Trebonia sp.]
MTKRDRGGPPDPEAYWRRRFIILGGGLSALMLAAWAFGSGGPSPAASRTAAARASMAARESRTSLPSTAYGNAWTPSAPAFSPAVAAAGLTRPKASPTATRTTKGAATASPAVSSSAMPGGAGAHGGAGASASAGARASAGGHGDAGVAAGTGTAGTRCARGDIVLSLFTGEPAYR